MSCVNILRQVVIQFGNEFVPTVLWKESLNSDGQQFHKYQPNVQSPLRVSPQIIEDIKDHDITYDIGNLSPGLATISQISTKPPTSNWT